MIDGTSGLLIEQSRAITFLSALTYDFAWQTIKLHRESLRLLLKERHAAIFREQYHSYTGGLNMFDHLATNHNTLATWSVSFVCANISYLFFRNCKHSFRFFTLSYKSFVSLSHTFLIWKHLQFQREKKTVKRINYQLYKKKASEFSKSR